MQEVRGLSLVCLRISLITNLYTGVSRTVLRFGKEIIQCDERTNASRTLHVRQVVISVEDKKLLLPFQTRLEESVLSEDK
jgi:hypothetical protein